MKKLLALLFIAGAIVTFSSCSDDEVVDMPAPSVTAPTATTSVQVGEVVNVTFNVATEGGYAGSSVSATGGSATVISEPAEGDESGNVAVEFTAGTTSGAGSVTLTVTDQEGDSDDATAIINVSPSHVPTIAGVPATASITADETFGPVTVTIDMDDVPGTLTIMKNGEEFGDPINVTSDGQTVDFSYEPTREEAGSTITFEFTAEDGDGDVNTETHVLSVTYPEVETIVVSANITENTTWETGIIYELAGRITVLSGVTLTIEPGVVIKGQPGTEANSKVLLIARGGTLNANGTAEQPIIFTSTSDQIIPGQFQSPNLDPTVNGLWGGLVILGNAPISVGGGATQAQIEGIPTSDTNGLYGGDNPADNSGTITYVSVRHGGTLIGSGNEINGITLGGVGSGTTISNVEVVGNQDDGIEWFGGNVNVTNALIWNSGDDALDTDQDWIGTCDNFVIVSPDGSAFELDGPEGTLKRGVHTFVNGTVYAGDKISQLVDWDSGDQATNAELQNIYFYGFTSTYGVVEDDPNTADVNESFSPIGSYGGDGVGTNSGWEYTLTSGGRQADEIFNDVPTSILTEVDVNANTVGADVSVFGWTWASKSGALSSVGME